MHSPVPGCTSVWTLRCLLCSAIDCPVPVVVPVTNPGVLPLWVMLQLGQISVMAVQTLSSLSYSATLWRARGRLWRFLALQLESSKLINYLSLHKAAHLGLV